MSFYTGTSAEVLFTLGAAVTKNTYTTQACIGPLLSTAPVPTIPAGYFTTSPNGVGRPLLLTAFGTIANAATAATFSPAFAIDVTANTALAPVTIYTTTAPTASTTCQWEMEAWITCQAVGGITGSLTLQVNGHWRQSILASGGAPSTAALEAQFAATISSGISANVALFPELFGTWSASSASATTTIQQMFLFGLN
jgi:hypothetical protein